MDNYTESKQRHVEYEHVDTCNYSNVTVIENKENPGVLFPLPNEPFFFSLSCTIKIDGVQNNIGPTLL